MNSFTTDRNIQDLSIFNHTHNIVLVEDVTLILSTENNKEDVTFPLRERMGYG